MRTTTSLSIFLAIFLFSVGAEQKDFEPLLKKFAEEGLKHAMAEVEFQNRLRALKMPPPKDTLFDLGKSPFTPELGDIQFQTRARLHTGELLVDALGIEKEKVPSFLEDISLENTVLGKSCAKTADEKPIAVKAIDQQPRATVEYRSYDGTGNNVVNTAWGSARSLFRRLMTPDYGNGLNSPRGTGTGQSLPSARFVSDTVATDLDRPMRNSSLMLMQWGQFLDHDITETPVSTNQGASISCCSNNTALPASSLHSECFPISIPTTDPFYSQFGATCMNFVRSECGISGGCSLGVRQQLNGITAFIDGSQIYGSSETKARSLRSFVGGKLTMSNTAAHPLLPQDSSPCPISNVVCYVAGDSRVNEQVDLTVMHTIWAREHNRIAGILGTQNPTWNDERLYQETRRIVGAELQHITYNEFLPIILGRQPMTARNLILSPSFSSKYDPQLDPSISNSFSAAAYRFGHSMVDGIIRMYTDPTTEAGNLLLHESFFNPSPITAADKFISLVKGLNFQPSQRIDDWFTISVTDRLFQSNGKFGADLVARNIQRGRDHGLPSYTKWLKFCNITWDGTLTGLGANMQTRLLTLLNTAYNGKAEDIDLFIGGVIESPYQDGLVGPTFSCILMDTFNRLRRGDRFFYEEPGPQAFTDLQLRELKKVTLSRVICDNTGVASYPRRAFVLPSADKNPLTPCSEYIPMDLRPWV